jgi:hypothetical protein
MNAGSGSGILRLLPENSAAIFFTTRDFLRASLGFGLNRAATHH